MSAPRTIWLTEVARFLGCSPEFLEAQAAAGCFVAIRRVDGRAAVAESDLRPWLRERPQWLELAGVSA